MLMLNIRNAQSLTQKQLTRESSDGDLDGGEKDESVQRHCEVFPVSCGRTYSFTFENPSKLVGTPVSPTREFSCPKSSISL